MEAIVEWFRTVLETSITNCNIQVEISRSKMEHKTKLLVPVEKKITVVASHSCHFYSATTAPIIPALVKLSKNSVVIILCKQSISTHLYNLGLNNLRNELKTNVSTTYTITKVNLLRNHT